MGQRIGRRSAKLLNKKRFSRTFTVIQESNGSRVDGIWQTGDITETEFVGSQQPATDKQRLQLPEGERLEESFLVILNTEDRNLIRPLKVGVNAADSDKIYDGSVYYWVRGVKDFSDFGHLDVLTIRVEGAAPTQVSKPVGSFSTPVVTFSTSTEGATLYYTTDGTTPTAASTEYTTPITITETTAFKVIAIKAGLTDSAVLNFGAYLVATTPIVTLKTGQTVQYSGMADDGYYKSGHAKPTYTINTTGDQSGSINITVNAKTVAVSNETVIDDYTGLEWVRNPCKTVLGAANNGRLFWHDSVNREDIFEFIDQANAGSLGGYTDWRIPNFHEFLSLLVEMEAPIPWCDITAFPNWLTSLVWVSTTASSTIRAYLASPQNGQLSLQVKDALQYFCWPVRRGI